VTLSVSPERPVPESVVAVLGRVAQAASVEGLSYAVAGALARDLLLFHVFGEPTRAATPDVGLLVRVGDWAAFARFRSRLVAERGLTPTTGRPQRLVDRAGEVALELVPFGGVEDPPGTIAWPPEGRVLTSVAGCREAAAAAVTVTVSDGLTVPVVALAALSLLKVTSWLDRRHETEEDAGDLLLLLRRYAAAGNGDRLYAAEVELLRSCGFDPELAGGRLLARDAVRLCGAALTRAVLERMSVAHWRDLSEQVLRQAAHLGEDVTASRTRDLVVGFWDELHTAVAGA
jgi:predicted nucleotidyltransferase